MCLSQRHCPECNSENFKRHCRYKVKSGEPRTLFLCQDCHNYFSETKHTPLERLKTPVSRISLVLEAINDGMGLNAACRTFHVGKNTIKRWINRLGGLKESLLLYALCHHFIQLQIEGDELYTKVSENKPAHLSEGWTVVLMDRASRFIWEMQCGERNTDLFKQAIATLARVIEQTDDLSLFTDGERRYGNLLFEICQEVIRTGQVGRPKKLSSLA
jgi:transposase-like protein